ncbi:hypothetical protein B0H10DRAFT_1941812 [Mycena sp. CBHHK59/15]|nr:hypothetical protein B0H10DRAFT_1941812 [Mycena sp. CBHHK59/15]
MGHLGIQVRPLCLLLRLGLCSCCSICDAIDWFSRPAQKCKDSHGTSACLPRKVPETKVPATEALTMSGLPCILRAVVQQMQAVIKPICCCHWGEPSSWIHLQEVGRCKGCRLLGFVDAPNSGRGLNQSREELGKCGASGERFQVLLILVDERVDKVQKFCEPFETESTKTMGEERASLTFQASIASHITLTLQFKMICTVVHESHIRVSGAIMKAMIHGHKANEVDDSWVQSQ